MMNNTTQPSIPALPTTPVARAVVQGLGRNPRHLPRWLSLDSEGSALAERINELDSYYPARIERQIFERDGAEIMEIALGRAGAGHGGLIRRPRMQRPMIVELGSGGASRTGLLLRHRVDALYVPIDPSPWALGMARKRLARQLPDLDVLPYAATIEDGLGTIERLPGPKAILLLGSALGDYDDREAVRLLRGIAAAAGDGAPLVLGVDLVKSPGIMVPAYDDAGGLAAALDKNALGRINNELGGTFDLDRFEHVAIWNDAHSAVELFLQSTTDQQVAVRHIGKSFAFEQDELIRTRAAVKYDLAHVARLLTQAGFERERTFLDPKNFYAVQVARVAAKPWHRPM